MSIEEIRRALREAGLERLAEQVERLVLSAIRIDVEPVNGGELPVGASKIGGRPDLPPDVAWPEHNGRPLGFLAQFHLAEVAPYDVEHLLPPRGLLSFFYDFVTEPWGIYPHDRMGWQVLHFNADEASPVRTDWPRGLAGLCRLPAHSPIYSMATTPTYHPECVAGIQLSDDERHVFWDVIEPWTPLPSVEDRDARDLEVERFIDQFVGLATRHQLLGHPLPLPHNRQMPLECERLSAGLINEHSSDLVDLRLAGAYGRWRLLLQLGNISGMPFSEGDEADDSPSMGLNSPSMGLSELCDLWARGGLMYFWIERDRLPQRDFSNMWMLGGGQF